MNLKFILFVIFFYNKSTLIYMLFYDSFIVFHHMIYFNISYKLIFKNDHQLLHNFLNLLIILKIKKIIKYPKYSISIMQNNHNYSKFGEIPEIPEKPIIKNKITLFLYNLTEKLGPKKSSILFMILATFFQVSSLLLLKICYKEYNKPITKTIFLRSLLMFLINSYIINLKKKNSHIYKKTNIYPK